MSARRLVLVSAWVGVAFGVLAGAWAFLAPDSFYEVVAPYPPFNRHLFHDLGAFQLGIAAALVAGLVRRPAIAVGLWGGAVGATLHAVSHWIDADLGGRASDPWLLSLLALVLVAGLIATEVRR
ncbi:MAG TPA: hypothetical protein VHI97_05875 [Actinomycetota bacterium]|nr:hypothetical protein [Actinomycetota bacterium]